MRVALFLPVVVSACIGPFKNLDQERESAIVTSNIAIDTRSFVVDNKEWASDPTAGCEVTKKRKEDLHAEGAFRFLMAADKDEPKMFAVDVYLNRQGQISAYYGL